MRFGRWMVLMGLAALVTVTALEGCSGGTSSSVDLCTSAPACSRGTAPSSAAAQLCTASLNDAKCGATYRAMKECQTYRPTCTSSGSYSSSATNAACAAEITAHNQCSGSSPTDGGADGCRRRTCAQANANCGEVDDGCGQKLQCGVCTNGQTCGGGTPNRCGCKCDPSWCGTVDACGTTVTCPNNCTAPQFCGGGAIANRCGCVPSGVIGPLTATSLTTASIVVEAGSTASWSSPANARLSDNVFASASMVVGASTQYLVALGYTAGLPAGATVDGIVVQVERSTTSGVATQDNAVHLVKNTQIMTGGANKAAIGIWPAAETTVSYGGPTDTWGSTWTAADINAGGFGVAFSAAYTGQLGSEIARIDSIRVTVYYSGVVCQ